MTSEPAFTILLPVHRPPDLMVFAIQSVLAQTRGDFELCIICDGTPPETVAAAEAAAAKDPRLRVFPFPKGERNGEAHRHIVLQQARGRMICQIADDDIWFPEHLAEMARLLGEVEFGNTLHTWLTPDGQFTAEFHDLADPRIQVRMQTQLWNFFGPTVSGYRLAAYRRLPVGWSPTPPDIWSDLAMWRKFLSLPGLGTGTRFAVTSLHFKAALRKDWPLDQRQEENAYYAGLATSERWRDQLRQQALSHAVRLVEERLAAAAADVANLQGAVQETQRISGMHQARAAELEHRLAELTSPTGSTLGRRLRHAFSLMPSLRD